MEASKHYLRGLLTVRYDAGFEADFWFVIGLTEFDQFAALFTAQDFDGLLAELGDRLKEIGGFEEVFERVASGGADGDEGFAAGVYSILELVGRVRNARDEIRALRKPGVSAASGRFPLVLILHTQNGELGLDGLEFLFVLGFASRLLARCPGTSMNLPT